jgi:glycerophosphoryl diester phosphodiesterase
MIEGAAPLAALRRSARLVRRQPLRVAATLIVWFVLVFVGSSAIVIVGSRLEDWLLHIGSRRLSLALIVIGSLLAAESIVAIVIGFVSATGYCLILARLYAALAADAPSAAERPPANLFSDARRARLAWLVVLVTAGVAIALAVSAVESLNVDRPILITAHRGSSRSAPENTLAAIRQAIDDGADFAEIDVQATRDGTIVLLHDGDFARLAGDPRKVWDLTLNEVRSLDVGSRFSASFAGERVPTLQEAIDLARGRIRLNIELKYNRPDGSLARRVVEIVQANEFHAECVLSSLDLQAVLQANQLDERLRVGLISFRSIGRVHRLAIDFLSTNVENVGPTLVTRLHAADKQVHAWTVNDPQ